METNNCTQPLTRPQHFFAPLDPPFMMNSTPKKENELKSRIFSLESDLRKSSEAAEAKARALQEKLRVVVQVQ